LPSDEEYMSRVRESCRERDLKDAIECQTRGVFIIRSIFIRSLIHVIPENVESEMRIDELLERVEWIIKGDTFVRTPFPN